MIKWLRLAVTGLALSLTLAGCGGGGSDVVAGVGSGGTGSTPPTAGTTEGTVSGFGSVIVEQSTFDDSALTVQKEVDPSAPTIDTTTSLALGQRVQLSYDISGASFAARLATLSAEVVGRITAIDNATSRFVVAGQTIAVSVDPAAPTVYDGASGFADLSVLTPVTVYGIRNGDGVVVATRVEVRDPALPAVTRVVGPIAGLDTTAKTFTIGSLLVNYSAATVLPSGGTLANDQRVAVYAPTNGTTTLAATVVRIQVPFYVEGQQARRAGFVAQLDFAAKTFKLAGVDVNASNATFTNGTAADLANGRRVRVIGTYTGSRIVASGVTYVVNQGDAAVQLTGPVTDFVSAASFRVRGVPVDASATTVAYLPADATSANLANGVIVKVTGSVSGNVVLPSAIEFVDTGTTRSLFGLVSGYDSTAGTFRLFGLSMRLDAACVFLNADGTAAARGDFGNGDLATVSGTLNSGVFVVTKVVLRGSFSHTSVEGSLYEFNLTTNRFLLNGSVVQVTPGTVVVGGSLSNLTNGVVVQVEGTVSGGVVQATTITITSPNGDAKRVAGYVTGYVSAGQFLVAGQRVDARLATFSPTGTSAADIVNGAYLAATGPVDSTGILRAVTVTFRTP
ncbi:hypothetical protein BH10PSE17_BH10PSE17_37330 [soil metagenome]